MMQRSPDKQKYTAETSLKILIHVAIVCVKISPKMGKNEKASYNLGGRLVSNGNSPMAW